MEKRLKPSVSKLIGLLDKPALLYWANKIGLEGTNIRDYRKKSTAAGSSIHKQIENCFLHGEPFENPEDQERFENYFSNKDILEIEKDIETDYFQGRYDLKLGYNGKTFLCDFKSNQRTIYFENKLQLVAYRMAEKCDGVGIISVPDFKFIPVFIEDYTPYEQILINLSNIYQLKEQLS